MENAVCDEYMTEKRKCILVGEHIRLVVMTWN